MKNNPAAVLIRKTHRKATQHLQAHMRQVFILYSAFLELEQQLGRAGLKHWMAISCPEIKWEEVELTLSHVEQSPLNAHVARKISGN